ncbi:uncharacterized protein LOC142764778 [Rhipicephalus microplus]|uniref:uncharacterized protein LOC142764778 n=1 Tax=Rhipicephalus microplus TaxID=6941 RepID=UPI003F6C4AA6
MGETPLMSSLWYIILILWSVNTTPSLSQLSSSQDIRQFYCSRNIVWTIKTTERTEYSCKVDVVVETKRTFATFSRLYYWHSSKVNNTMTGKFVTFSRGKLRHCSKMKVYTPGIPLPETETLQYKSRDGKCGIFIISTSSGLTYHELRVWNSALRNLEQRCVKYFYDIAAKHKLVVTQLYKAYCHNILLLK